MNRRLNSKEEVNEYFDSDKIECLVCGQLFKSLASHLLHKHNISVNEYKNKFNIPWGKSLVGKETSKKMSINSIEKIKSGKTVSISKLKITDKIKSKKDKKRPLKDYFIEELKPKREKILNNHKENSYKKAVALLDKAEELNIPLWRLYTEYGISDHNLRAVMSDFPELKKRYEIFKNKISNKIEDRLNKPLNEIIDIIKKLHNDGLSFVKIGEKLNIGRSSAERLSKL